MRPDKPQNSKRIQIHHFVISYFSGVFVANLLFIFKEDFYLYAGVSIFATFMFSLFIFVPEFILFVAFRNFIERHVFSVVLLNAVSVILLFFILFFGVNGVNCYLNNTDCKNYDIFWMAVITTICCSSIFLLIYFNLTKQLGQPLGKSKN